MKVQIVSTLVNKVDTSNQHQSARLLGFNCDRLLLSYCNAFHVHARALNDDLCACIHIHRVVCHIFHMVALLCAYFSPVGAREAAGKDEAELNGKKFTFSAASAGVVLPFFQAVAGSAKPLRAVFCFPLSFYEAHHGQSTAP